MPSPRPPKSDAYRAILRELLDAGGLSRAELYRRTGMRPNTIGEAVDEMASAGWVRESGSLRPARRLPGEGRGRPAVRVEIDESRRDVVGLAIRPKRVEAVRLSLRGQVIGDVRSRALRGPRGVARIAAGLLAECLSPRSLAVGVSSTGLIDEGDMKLLFNSISHGPRGLSLGPVLSVVGDLPLAMENNIHALGDRWRLAHPAAGDETVLLVELGDGEVGASFMPGGGPADAGCVRGGNELGHTQVPAPGVEVSRCFCGQPRCLERVFSTPMVRRLTGTGRRLGSVLAEWARAPMALTVAGADPGDPGREPAAWIMGRLVEAVSNTANLLRPHRVVWTGTGPIARVLPELEAPLSRAVSANLMPVLRERVGFEAWTIEEHAGDLAPAVTAGHLALAILTRQRAAASGEVRLDPNTRASAPREALR
ncbi:MAG: ROK family transcriptional regulator [Planctomycetota bacterium]